MAVPQTQTYNYGDALTLAVANVFDEMHDNITNNIGLYNYLNKRGQVKTFDGGFEIRHPLNYAENSTYQSYSGAETLTLAAEDTMTYAIYAIKQVALTVQVNGLEDLQVSGEEQLFDLLEERMNVATRTFKNRFSVDMYSSGTGTGGKQIGGLQSLVADTSTSGTVGGIDRSTWSFWRNFTYSALNDGGAAVTSANIQDYLLTLTLNTTRNGEGPDVYIADNNYFGAYHQSLMLVQRVTVANTGDGKAFGAGSMELEYMGKPFVMDGGIGGACPTNHVYALNTSNIMLRPHARRNLTKVGGQRQSVNQDATVSVVGWAGNMTMGYAKGQGVLTA